MTRSWPKLVLGSSLLALFPTAWIIYPWVMAPTKFTVCLYRTLTDSNCPFCGLTRALASGTHGEFQSAQTYHPLWWVAAVLIAVAAVLALIDGAIGSQKLSRLRERTKFLDLYIIIGLLGFWLWRDFL